MLAIAIDSTVLLLLLLLALALWLCVSIRGRGPFFATRSTRRWLHRGRAFAVAPNSFALHLPHVAYGAKDEIDGDKRAAPAPQYQHTELCY